ncbi:hypothetical protein [Pseudoalteromonas sp. XI10]|uniref:hypothetical protein n=1 Tax=Pseudoalteromonas sp. XI10 TaxID=1766621 RepID=UPI000B095B29|nr:hypothetical protein [Pseudoalteromonas sp. XI10]
MKANKIKMLFLTLFLVGCGGGGSESNDEQPVTIDPPPVQEVEPLLVTVAVQGEGYEAASLSVLTLEGDVVLSGSNSFKYAEDGAYVFDIYSLQDNLEERGFNLNSPIIFEASYGGQTFKSMTVGSYFTLSGSYLLLNKYTDFFVNYAEGEVIESHNDITELANNFFVEFGHSDSNLDGLLDYIDIGLFDVERDQSDLLDYIDEYYASTAEVDIVSYVRENLNPSVGGIPFTIQSNGSEDLQMLLNDVGETDFYYSIEESCPSEQSVTDYTLSAGESFTFSSGCAISYSFCYDEEVENCGLRSYLYNDSGLLKADSISLSFDGNLSGISKSILQISAAQLRDNSEFMGRLDNITRNETIGSSLKNFRVCKLFVEFGSHCGV